MSEDTAEDTGAASDRDAAGDKHAASDVAATIPADLGGHQR